LSQCWGGQKCEDWSNEGESVGRGDFRSTTEGEEWRKKSLGWRKVKKVPFGKTRDTSLHKGLPFPEPQGGGSRYRAGKEGD